MSALREYFEKLSNEEYVLAVQSAAIAILAYYFKQNIEINKGKEADKQFKIEWFPGKWLGFWESFAPKSAKLIIDKDTGTEKKVNFTVVEMLKEFEDERIVFKFKRPLKSNKSFKANVYVINPEKKDFILNFINKGFPSQEIQSVLAMEIKRYKEINDPAEGFISFKSILKD